MAEFTVVRAKRAGRPISKSTVAARSTLDKLWKGSKRDTVRVTDEQGNEVRSYKAVVVDAETLGKPAGFTGLAGLIGSWAKDNGHAVTVRKVSETHYAIENRAE